MVDLDRVLGEASRPQRTVKQRRRTSLGATEIEAAQQAYDAAVDAAREFTVEFTFTALSAFRVRQLIKNNPPRDDHPEDKSEGYNRDAYVWHLIRECLTGPDVSDEQFVTMFGDSDAPGDGVLSAGQFRVVVDTVSEINYVEGTSVPF